MQPKNKKERITFDLMLMAVMVVFVVVVVVDVTSVMVVVVIAVLCWKARRCSCHFNMSLLLL